MAPASAATTARSPLSSLGSALHQLDQQSAKAIKPSEIMAVFALSVTIMGQRPVSTPPISTFLWLVSVVDPLSRYSDLMQISDLNCRPAAMSWKAVGGHNSTVCNSTIKAADLKWLKGS